VILAFSGEPKLTVGAVVKLKVFDSFVDWIHVNIQLVVHSLTWVFHKYAEVKYVVIQII